MNSYQYAVDANLAKLHFWWDVAGTAGQVAIGLVIIWLSIKAIRWFTGDDL